jgi:hypothetical protein
LQYQDEKTEVGYQIPFSRYFYIFDHNRTGQ